MIKFVYWRHHEKFEEEEDDSEAFRIMSFAIYLEENMEGSVESITLADGTILEGIREIEDYYEAHKMDEHAVEGSAIVIDEQRLLTQEAASIVPSCLGLIYAIVQFDVIIGYACDECGATCKPDEEFMHREVSHE